MAFEKAEFKLGETSVKVEFNPSEYTISTVSKAQEQKGDSSQNPWWATRRAQKTAIGERETTTLQFTLHFDTNMHSGTWGQEESSAPQREDVRTYTNKVLEMSRSGLDGKKQLVQFLWGSLDFLGTIEQIDQKFTMFGEDGRPLRAQLDITMVSEENSIFLPKTGGTASDIDWSGDQWQTAVSTQLSGCQGKIRLLLSPGDEKGEES